MASISYPTRDVSFYPLHCEGTSLSPQVLFAAKALVLYMLLTDTFFTATSGVFLPFLPVFDSIPDPVLFGTILKGLFLVFATMLLLNRQVRLSCFILGSILLLSILSERATYSSTKSFYGCFLFLVGLQEEGKDPWQLRVQVALVYFGSGINKLFDADWQSGQYFQYITHEILHHKLFMTVANYLPEMLLSQMMCWLVIFTELSLGIGFFMPSHYKKAIVLGICFHLGMFIFTGGLLSIVFTYAMFLSYLAFIQWPKDSPLLRYNLNVYFIAAFFVIGVKVFIF